MGAGSGQSPRSHGDLLRSFKEVGGLLYCPKDVRKEILYWLVVTYLGEPGRVTRYGNLRHVFYSDTAAPLIEEIIREVNGLISEEIQELAKRKTVKIFLALLHMKACELKGIPVKHPFIIGLRPN